MGGVTRKLSVAEDSAHSPHPASPLRGEEFCLPPSPGAGRGDELRRIVAEEIARALEVIREADNVRDSGTAREAMKAEEVARFLGVDRKTVYEYANRGRIPCRKLGKRLLFSRQAIVAWLGSCETASSRQGGK